MPCEFACISWEAAATLITGGAAVGGAIWIGLRQVGIGNRQAEIVEKQVEVQAGQLRLEELKARMALFEERMKVYSATEHWLIRFAQEGKKPTGDAERDFMNAIDRSRFLFGDDLRTKLHELWTLGNAHHYHEVSFPIEGGDHADKAHEIALKLTEAMSDLPAIFGPKIDLSDVS